VLRLLGGWTAELTGTVLLGSNHTELSEKIEFENQCSDVSGITSCFEIVPGAQSLTSEDDVNCAALLGNLPEGGIICPGSGNASALARNRRARGPRNRAGRAGRVDGSATQQQHVTRTLTATSARLGDRSSKRALWTDLRCARRTYRRQHPGRPTVADVDAGCQLCGAPLRSVTTFPAQRAGHRGVDHPLTAFGKCHPTPC
jgi:hypothetical protein